MLARTLKPAGYFFGMREPYTKSALTYGEQLELLRGRGLDVGDADAAEFYLANLNYYRLAAYWLPFESDHATHRFMADASFDRVLALYIFDRELRLLTLDALEHVEVAVRARWAHELARAHGPHAHLDRKLHQRTPEAYDRDLRTLLEAVTRAERQEVFIRHLLSKYEEPLPAIWAVCEVMPFGLLSRWYGNLSDAQVRTAIAREFDLDHRQLGSWLHHLSIVRNVCAHHGRLWNREFTVTPTTPRSKPDGLAPRWNLRSRQLYNTLLIVLHFMDVVAPHHTWRDRLRDHLATLDAPGGIEAMGFPARDRCIDL